MSIISNAWKKKTIFERGILWISRKLTRFIFFISKWAIPKETTDPNKFLPLKYPWARRYYEDAIANSWFPSEVPMQQDKEQWEANNVLSKEERKLIMMNLGFFSTAESLTANNIVLAVYRHVINPESRQYLLRQAFEEAVHTDTFIYCCDSLRLDPEEVYGMYETVPSIKEKDDFVVSLTKAIFDPAFQIKSKDDIKTLLHDLVGYYVIMEGIFFYAGFAMMLALKNNEKMIGIGQQFEWIMRDESLHLGFGCDLINTIKRENKGVWTSEFQDEITSLIEKAVELEKKYALDACPNGILKISAQQFIKYVEYIADRRLEKIGLKARYFTPNPFPWMSQSTDLNKEKNFFETTITEYKHGSSLSWDDDGKPHKKRKRIEK